MVKAQTQRRLRAPWALSWGAFPHYQTNDFHAYLLDTATLQENKEDFMEERPYVSWELMDRFLTDVFVGYGVPREDAAICADVLLESDRRGIESHAAIALSPFILTGSLTGH